MMGMRAELPPRKITLKAEGDDRLWIEANGRRSMIHLRRGDERSILHSFNFSVIKCYLTQEGVCAGKLIKYRKGLDNTAKIPTFVFGMKQHTSKD